MVHKMSYIGRKFFSINFPSTIVQVRNINNSNVLRSDKVPEEFMPKNVIEQYYNKHLQPKGKIYDKRPFKMNLEAGRRYNYCACGHSKSQPLCDGSHNILAHRNTIKPIPFEVAETKEYWLCNCKQSEHRPFCDGTHLKHEKVLAIRYFKT